MECPFKEQIELGSLVCDFGGVCHEPGVVQCPTEIFNKCQMGNLLELAEAQRQN